MRTVKARKIKVMQVTHDLAIGGLQRVIVNICKGINRDIFDVSVLCLRRYGEFQPELEEMGVKTFLLPDAKESGLDYLSVWKIKRILKEQQTDVVHTHNTQPFVQGGVAAFIAGVKTVVHTDHARSYPDKWRYMFAERVVSHLVRNVVAVSDSTAQDLIQRVKIPARKVITVPNGIDGNPFCITVDKDEKKKELGFGGRGPVIGFASRVARQKGLTYLLKAMPEIIQVFPECVLVIAGEGPEESPLQQEAANLNIKDHVVFLGPRLDIPELLKLFDILVLPSVWEGLPMILLEAMAAGCPTVATDVGGVSTAIKNGESGVLVEAENPAALSREIVSLLSDEDKRKVLSEKGRRRFLDMFSAEVMTRKYEELYLSGANDKGVLKPLLAARRTTVEQERRSLE
ncbi:MAG: glycosyltransferase family 4 protein [Nitrospirota bacterium]